MTLAELKDLAQLANLLLLPGVLVAVKILSHVKLSEAFMKSAAADVKALDGRLRIVEEDTAILKDRDERGGVPA